MNKPAPVNGQILFGGDPNGQFAHILTAAEQLQPQAGVLLGDMEFRRAAHIELEPIGDRPYFVHGSHDADGAEASDNLTSFLEPNLGEQLRRSHVQRVRHPQDGNDPRILSSAFDASHVRAVEV